MLDQTQTQNTLGSLARGRPNSKRLLDAQLGRRVKLRRTLLGLTQEQVAAACGITAQQVHKYETGQAKLSTLRLLQVSAVLETSVGWFFDGLDTGEPLSGSLGKKPLDKAMPRLVSLAQQIKSKQRLRQLLDFAKLLAEADEELA